MGEQLLDSVLRIVSTKPRLSNATGPTLREVFELSLQRNPVDRASDIGRPVELLSTHDDYGRM